MLVVAVMSCLVGASRGEAIHNPGCIRKVKGQVWKGQAKDQTDPDLVVFANDHWGLRAMARVLGNYQERHSLKTVRQIITRWCGDENANNYIDFVNDLNGWRIHKEMQFKDVPLGHLSRMMEAIIRWENGRTKGEKLKYSRGAIKAGAVSAWPEWFSRE